MTNIIQNKKGSTVVVSVSTNTTIQVTDLAFSNDEVIGAFNITKMFWSTANTITVARGANNILFLNRSDNWPLDMFNISLSQFNTANLVVTIPDGASSIVFELRKINTSYFSDYIGASGPVLPGMNFTLYNDSMFVPLM